MATVMTTALGFIAWTLYCWEAPIVKRSHSRFLVMLCSGTIIMSSAIVTIDIDNDNASPEVAEWPHRGLSAWVYSYPFPPFFSKIWRINKIFQNPDFRRIKVTEADVLVPFLVLFTLNFALLLHGRFMTPFGTNGTPSTNQTIPSLTECAASSTTELLVWRC